MLLSPAIFPCCSGEGPNGEEEVWFGRLVSFVVISRDNAEESWAFVQWYAEAAHNETTALTRMSRLKWCKHQRCIGRTGELSRMEYYDLIPLTKIIKPVFIQPDPTAADHFLYNHFLSTDLTAPTRLD